LNEQYHVFAFGLKFPVVTFPMSILCYRRSGVLLILPNTDMDQIAKRAIQRLDEMEIVGLSERFEESAEMVCSYLGVEKPAIMPLQRVSAHRQQQGNQSCRHSGTITAEEIRLIDKANEYDREIYAYGKKIAERQLKSRKRSFFSFVANRLFSRNKQ
jgi:hypothetical protein